MFLFFKKYIKENFYGVYPVGSLRIRYQKEAPTEHFLEVPFKDFEIAFQGFLREANSKMSH